jgi:hypothetical protein
MKVSLTYETTDAFNLALGLQNGEYKPASSKEIRTWMEEAVDKEAETLLEAFYAARKLQANKTNA